MYIKDDDLNGRTSQSALRAPPIEGVKAPLFKRGTIGDGVMNSNRLGQYTHIRSVCEKCTVGVNLAQKQYNVWDTSEIERTGGPGCTGYSTNTYRAYCSTQDNKVCTKGK